MKITDPDVIKNGERDLIDAVKEDLDLDAVKQILKDQIANTALAAKGGQIVVHDNQIAFRLDFDLNLSGSLMFDRDGNYIPFSNNDDTASTEDDATQAEDTDIDDINIEDALDDISIDINAAAPEQDDTPEIADSTLLNEELLAEDLPGPEPADIDPAETALSDQDAAETDMAGTETPGTQTDTEELSSDLTEEDLDMDLDEDEPGDIMLENFVDEDLEVQEDREDADQANDEDMDDMLEENRKFWEKK